MARPTKLTTELIKSAQEYLETYTTVVPTIEGLALYLKVNRDTLYDWEATNRDQAFSDIISDLKAKQASELIDGTLTGKYNATIAKLILSGRHNYIEKREQDITSGGDKIGVSLSAEQAEQLIRARAERSNT